MPDPAPSPSTTGASPIQAGDAPTPALAARSSLARDLAGRVVNLANIYRLILPPVMLILAQVTRPNSTVGYRAPALFVTVCGIYFVCAVALALVGRKYWPSRRALILSYTLLDASAIAMLLYCSGGVASGLGILLVVPVGSMALLAEGRAALVVAALAALALLVQQIVSVLTGGAGSGDYLLAGLMGAVLFLIALTAMPVSTRLRESEALVRRQEIDLANLAQLSQYIVQRLRESILVVDPSDHIRLINESAAQVLGDTLAVPGAPIGTLSPQLLRLIDIWRQHDSGRTLTPPGTFVAADGARLIRPHFAPLGHSEPAPIIIFLEDTGEIATRIQQTKLAALGRLSASIAHEVRNPVGAISHAAQLLGESPTLGSDELRLTQIMQTNCARVSRIIDNILQLSRREPPRPEQIALAEWTRRFVAEFCETLQLPASQLRLLVSEDLKVRFDATQLHQILWNLCQNAVAHAGGAPDAPEPIEIRYGRLAGIGRPYLQVADRGEGIDASDAERIFEPFFTRSTRGTGLGLFLARELAQANGATLLYEPRDGGGSVFRVVFMDPNRWAEFEG